MAIRAPTPPTAALCLHSPSASRKGLHQRRIRSSDKSAPPPAARQPHGTTAAVEPRVAFERPRSRWATHAEGLRASSNRGIQMIVASSDAALVEMDLGIRFEVRWSLMRQSQARSSSPSIAPGTDRPQEVDPAPMRVRGVGVPATCAAGGGAKRSRRQRRSPRIPRGFCSQGCCGA